MKVLGELVALIKDAPVATMLAIAVLLISRLFKNAIANHARELKEAKEREDGLRAELKAANAVAMELGERTAVLASDSIRQAPDFKWLRRVVAEAIRREEERAAPKPVRRRLPSSVEVEPPEKTTEPPTR